MAKRVESKKRWSVYIKLRDAKGPFTPLPPIYANAPAAIIKSFLIKRGVPLHSFDVRGRPMDHALKWSSDEDNGGFGPRATFVVFGAVSRTGVGGGSDVGRGRLWSEQQRSSPDDYGVTGTDGGGGGDDDGESYENSSKAALRVTNVTEQDAGAYRCRVDFRDSPTRNYRIILRVIGESP